MPAMQISIWYRECSLCGRVQTKENETQTLLQGLLGPATWLSRKLSLGIIITIIIFSTIIIYILITISLSMYYTKHSFLKPYFGSHQALLCNKEDVANQTGSRLVFRSEMEQATRQALNGYMMQVQMGMCISKVARTK